VPLAVLSFILFTPEWIISQVANQFDVSPDAYVGFRCRCEGREIAALLCRELTNASLAELSTAFGLAHPDSSANLAKKAKQLLGDSKKYKNNYHRIKETLLKTEPDPCEAPQTESENHGDLSRARQRAYHRLQELPLEPP